jgi:hypothetical protein
MVVCSGLVLIKQIVQPPIRLSINLCRNLDLHSARPPRPLSFDYAQQGPVHFVIIWPSQFLRIGAIVANLEDVARRGSGLIRRYSASTNVTL